MVEHSWLRKLIDSSAQLVAVLAEPEYTHEHPPAHGGSGAALGLAAGGAL